jgi:hypothetical protein
MTYADLDERPGALDDDDETFGDDEASSLETGWDDPSETPDEDDELDSDLGEES